MSIFRLTIKNLTSRPLSTILSLLLLTLGVGMISFLLQVNNHIQTQMTNNIRGIDMVMGAKGSPLQLILSAVYHIDDPTGNIDLAEANSIKRNRLVEFGIPLSYGDSFKGYRIVGTTHDYPKIYNGTLAEGLLWQGSMEVCIGSTIAQNVNLNVGDSFVGSHGLTDGGESHGDHEYVVVGIFEPSNSVLDQLILTASESVWDVHQHTNHAEDDEEEKHEEVDDDHAHDEDEDQHEHEGHSEDHEHDHEEHDHSEPEEITAMLIKFKNPMGLIQLPRMVNENTSMQAAVPSYEINRLFELMGVGVETLGAIALVIMIVSGLSVFISLFNALKDRQYEMALMRTYGATRWQLVRLMIQEGVTLTLTGFILGFLFSRLGLWLVSFLVESNYHYSFMEWHWLPEEVWLFVIAISIGLLAALLPAIRVFRINISKVLADA